MSRQRSAPRLFVISALSAALGWSAASAASAKELVNLVCVGTNHVTGKAGKRTIKDDEFPWKQHYTLDDNGTFIALTGPRSEIARGKLLVTTRRYYLDFDSTDPEIRRNGGGLYIDRDTGALYAVSIKHDGGKEFTFISTGQCKVDAAPPKF
jgi:hypothetical protein